MTDVDDALLPCPFCGGDELSHGWAAPGWRGGMSDGHVQCHTCDTFIVADTEAEAIAAWNRRAGHAARDAEVAAKDAEIERLREALRHIVDCDRKPETDRADHYQRVARAALGDRP